MKTVSISPNSEATALEPETILERVMLREVIAAAAGDNIEIRDADLVARFGVNSDSWDGAILHGSLFIERDDMIPSVSDSQPAKFWAEWDETERRIRVFWSIEGSQISNEAQSDSFPRKPYLYEVAAA